MVSPKTQNKIFLKEKKTFKTNLWSSGDALCDLVPFVQFLKKWETPMEECYF